MGLTRSAVQKFSQLADTTMAGLFPASLRINGVTYAGMSTGGAAETVILEGGFAPAGSRWFRISKDLIAPGVIFTSGMLLEWLDATGGVTAFRIMKVPDRPQETSQAILCEPRDR